MTWHETHDSTATIDANDPLSFELTESFTVMRRRDGVVRRPPRGSNSPLGALRGVERGQIADRVRQLVHQRRGRSAGC